jgi:hypothetical protein
MRYLRVEPNGALAPYAGERPFRAVVVAEEAVSPEWQALASKWLVASGCLYMLAWGRECSSWDDSVALANSQAFDYGDIPDDAFVMTTWHDKESLREVFWFAKSSAFVETVEIVETVVFHVSHRDRSTEYAELFAAS